MVSGWFDAWVSGNNKVTGEGEGFGDIETSGT